MSNFDGAALVLNIGRICRICLVEMENMRSVYSELEQIEVLEPNLNHLSDILARITYVPVNQQDGYPSHVCNGCVDLIYAAYKFKLQYDHSYTIIQQYLTQNAKKEQEILQDSKKISEKPETRAKSATTKSRTSSLRQIERRNQDKPIRQQRKRRTKQNKVESSDAEEEEMSDNDVKNVVLLHPCPVCTKEFTAVELKEHAHTHKALQKYLSIPEEKKVPADAKFYVKPLLKKSVTSIHYRKEKNHRCVMCNGEFSATVLRSHLETHRNLKEYKCDQCDRIFKKLNHLNTHRVKHLKEYPYKCEHCGKGFVIKTNYECHVLTHNSNEELPHECRHCLKRFSNPEHLNRHILIHTENISYSVKYKVCKCHRCLETFKDREDLKSHECIPVPKSANVRFPCKLCKKVFKNSSALYSHNRNVHQLKGAKTLCSVCGKHVSNIHNHMMSHSGERPFSCNQCEKKFIGKQQLKQHLLVHSGFKPYICRFCSKAFNNNYNLQVHERIHKGDRCHVCTICDKKFLEKSYLKKHMQIHTKA